VLDLAAPGARLAPAALDRFLEPLQAACRSSWPIALPSFSIMPSDSQSSWSMIFER
jgi:hypothetical protein